VPNLNLVPHPLIGTPYGTALDLCLVLAALVRLASVITRECSWVDRLWSLCPPAYCLIVAASLDFAAPRLNWTGLGFVLLIAVFIPSVRLTESISVGKYPGYRDYQGSTPMLVPWPRFEGAT